MLQIGKIARQLAGPLRSFHAVAAVNAAFPTSSLTIGVPKESYPGERRVGQSPESITKLIKKGFNVVVERTAGDNARFTDEMYETAGAKVVEKEDAWASDLVLKVRAPQDIELDMMKKGSSLFSVMQPGINQELVGSLTEKGITGFALDMIPRISRAQAYDVLSSMSNISGYRAVVEASSEFGRFFTGQITAAGKVPPAKVLVIGGGVAGLAAIGCAKNLGAVVRAFDTRPEVREQVESLGGQFLEMPGFELEGGEGGYAKEMTAEFIEAEMALFKKQCEEVDIVITTALIPGKPAPKLITKEMVDGMKPGSVIVDLAAETGGNCEYTKQEEVFVTDNGVRVIGHSDLPSRLPTQASSLFANNVTKYLSDILNEDGDFELDWEDVCVRQACVSHEGELMFPPPPFEMPAVAMPKEVSAEEIAANEISPFRSTLNKALLTSAALTSLVGIGAATDDPRLANLMNIFTLGCIIGYNVVWGVTPALHSPLMSVTNAISGMTAVGGMLLMNGGVVPGSIAGAMASTALLVSSVNIFGGFLVTKRMLDMFKRPDDPAEHNYLFALPAAAAIGTYAAAVHAGCPNVTTLAYLASGLGCIGGIAGLSTQKTARIGSALGMVGVSTGLAATLGAVGASPALLAQMAGLAAIGGGAGTYIGARVQPTELPELVAAFHSLVGLAATLTCFSQYLIHPDRKSVV